MVISIKGYRHESEEMSTLGKDVEYSTEKLSPYRPWFGRINLTNVFLVLVELTMKGWCRGYMTIVIHGLMSQSDTRLQGNAIVNITYESRL